MISRLGSVHQSIHPCDTICVFKCPTDTTQSFRYIQIQGCWCKKIQFSWFPAGLLHHFLTNIFPTHAFGYLHLPWDDFATTAPNFDLFPGVKNLKLVWSSPNQRRPMCMRKSFLYNHRVHRILSSHIFACGPNTNGLSHWVQWTSQNPPPPLKGFEFHNFDHLFEIFGRPRKKYLGWPKEIVLDTPPKNWFGVRWKSF